METFSPELTGLAEQLAESLANEYPSRGRKNAALRALLRELCAHWRKIEGPSDEDGFEDGLGSVDPPALHLTANAVRLVESASAALVDCFGGRHCKAKVLLSFVKYVRTVWGYLVAAGRARCLVDVEGDAASGTPLELPDDGEEFVMPSPLPRQAGAGSAGSPAIDLEYVRSLHIPARWGSAAPRVKLFAQALEGGYLIDSVGQYVLITDTDVSTGFPSAVHAQYAAERLELKGAIVMRVGREEPGTFKTAVQNSPQAPSGAVDVCA